jgi:hypothetical protein
MAVAYTNHNSPKVQRRPQYDFQCIPDHYEEQELGAHNLVNLVLQCPENIFIDSVKAAGQGE